MISCAFHFHEGTSLVGRVVAGLAAGFLIMQTAAPPTVRRNVDATPILAPVSLVKTVMVGFWPLVADYYWILTTHQIGFASNAAQTRDIGVYAEQVVALDPQFLLAYRFAAVSLPYRSGRDGSWVNVEQSTSLLRRALKIAPDDFRTKMALANNLFTYEKQYREAGTLLMELSARPEAPAYLAPLATRLLAQGGDIRTAWEFARALEAQSSDPELKALYGRRMKQLEQEGMLQVIDAASKRYRAIHGRQAASIDELLDAGLLPARPVDPLGGKIFLGPDGRGRATSEWYRLEIYDEEGKRAAAAANGDKSEFLRRTEP